MTQEQNNFISMIAQYVLKYAKQYNIHLASPIIAQAINESGWGRSTLAKNYNNYFGMKCGGRWNGKSVNLQTKEEYEAGTLTTINANFRVYDSIEECVEGYFIFISVSRYDNLHGTGITPRQYCENLLADGYATSRNYSDSLLTLIDLYHLTDYDLLLNGEDNKKTEEKTEEVFDVDKIARDVINGRYGNGEERKQKLGDKYAIVQKRVNEILGVIPAETQKPKEEPFDVEKVARDVINGRYGNGNERKQKLGDKYAIVQKRVNEILLGKR